MGMKDTKRDFLQRISSVLVAFLLCSAPLPGRTLGQNPLPPGQAPQFKKIQDAYRKKASQLEGSQKVNGIAYDTDTIARMVATRDVYVQQLQTFVGLLNNLDGWRKDQRIALLQRILGAKLWGDLLEYRRYPSTDSLTVTGYHTYFQRIADRLEAMGDKARAAIVRRAEELPLPDAERLLAQQLTNAIGGDPLVGGLYAHLKGDPLDNPSSFLVGLDLAIPEVKKGAQEEIQRASQITTVEGMSEFFKPQYANARLFAANMFGGLQEIRNFEDFAQLYQQNAQAEGEVTKLTFAIVVSGLAVIAIVAAPVVGGIASLSGASTAGTATATAVTTAVGSGVNLGAMGVQLVWDGKELIAVQSDVSHAEKGQVVIGQQAIAQLKREREGAIEQGGLDVIFATISAADFKMAVDAAREANAARAAAAAKGASATPTAAAGIPAAGVSQTAAERLAVQAEKGAVKAKQLGLDPQQVDKMLAEVQEVPSGPVGVRGRAPQARDLPVYQAERAFEQGSKLARIGSIDELTAQARAAGVPESVIQDIVNPSRLNGLDFDAAVVAASKFVPNQLRLAKKLREGAVIIFDKTPTAQRALSEMFGRLPESLANSLRGRVLTTDLLRFEGIKSNLSFMRGGRPVVWNPDDFAALQTFLGRPDARNLYGFIEGPQGAIEAGLERVLTDEEIQAGNQLLGAPNLQDVLQGKAVVPSMIDPSLLPFVPPTFLVDQSGHLISAEAAAKLTSAEIRQLSPEFVQNGIANQGLKSLLQQRMEQEALIILSQGGTPLESAWAQGVIAASVAATTATGNTANPTSSCNCNETQLLQSFHDARDKEAEARSTLEQDQATANADQDAMSAAGNALATGKGSQATLDAAIAKNQASQTALQKAQANYASAQQTTIAAEQAYDNCVNAKKNCPPPQNATNQGGSSAIGGKAGPPAGGTPSGSSPSNNTAGANSPVPNSPAAGTNSENNGTSGANPSGPVPAGQPTESTPPPNPPAAGVDNSGNKAAGGDNSGPSVAPPKPKAKPTPQPVVTPTAAAPRPPDFNHPMPYVNGDGTVNSSPAYTYANGVTTITKKLQVTICEGDDYVFPSSDQEVSIKVAPNVTMPGDIPDATGVPFGSSIRLIGKHVGGNEVEAYVVPTNGDPTVHLLIWVRVIDCNKRTTAVPSPVNPVVSNPVKPGESSGGGPAVSPPAVTPAGPNPPVGGKAPAGNPAGGSGGGATPGTPAGPGATPPNPCPPICDEDKLVDDLIAAEDAVKADREALATAEDNVKAADAAMAAAGAVLEATPQNSPAYPGLYANGEATKQADAAAVTALQTARNNLQTDIAKQEKAQQALDDCRNKKAQKDCPPPTTPTTPNETNTTKTNVGTAPMQSGAAVNDKAAGGGKGTIAGGGSSAGEPPLPPAPPVPEAPKTSPADGLPLLPDKPLQPCWPAGTDIKAACKAWLDIADHNELAAKLAADALANSQSDLNQADRLDASAGQWDAHSQTLSAFSAMYANDAQTYQQKAAASSTDQLAGQWQQMAADANNQANDITAQAATATAQANKIRQEAKALRDNVAAGKADLEAKTNAAAASRKAYNDCLALPACPPKENNQSIIPSPAGTPTGNPTGNGNGQNIIDGGLGALGAILGLPGLAALNALSNSLFGNAPSAPAVQNIIVTINVNPGGAAPAAPATTSGALRRDSHQIFVTAHRSAAQARARLRLAAYHFGSPSRAPAHDRATPDPDPSQFFAAFPSAGADLTFSIASNGNLGSNALQFRVHDPSGKLKGNIGLPQGMVLEPLKQGTPNPVNAPTSGSNLSQPLTAYCLEMAKLPPEPNQLYRIAPQAIQDKFKSLKPVLEAGSKLAAAGQFHPDSEPNAYSDFIRQNALWAKIEGWGEQKFTEVFIERTKKNAEHMKMNWTKEMEQALRSAAPGRWGDISMVLQEAQKLSGGRGTGKESLQ